MFGGVEQMPPPDLLPQLEFVATIEVAATLLSTVHAEERLPEPPRRRYRSRSASPKKVANWHDRVVHDSETRLFEVLSVLRRPRRGGERADRMYRLVFNILSKLTPNGDVLRNLAASNQELAYLRLVGDLEVAGREFVAKATLIPGEVTIAEAVREDTVTTPADERFASHAERLLARAGGAYSLTEAAKHVGKSRQAVHKWVYNGTALGMMQGEVIILPRLQFTDIGADGKLRLLPGISQVVKTFMAAQAGGWMALQFLVEDDPNLARPPIAALRSGQVERVVQAARSHLGMDEG